MAGKPLSAKQLLSKSEDKSSMVSEDIAKVVEYLNAKRSTAHERSSGLAQDISQRRDDAAAAHAEIQQKNLRLRGNAEFADPTPLPSQSVVETSAKPILAERYHAFCHDLDLLLDSFRARVEGNKPIQH